MNGLPRERVPALLFLVGGAVLSVTMSAVVAVMTKGAMRAVYIVFAVVAVAAACATLARLVHDGWFRSDGPDGQEGEPGKELDE